MKLQELIHNFKYKYDKKFDTWEIMEADENGHYYGDCEDFALTIKHKVYGFEDWDLWHCRLNGDGHAILMKDDLVVDNVWKKVVSWDTYIKSNTITNVYKYSSLRIKYELFLSSILRLMR